MRVNRLAAVAFVGLLPAASALAVNVGNVDEFSVAGDLENWGGGSTSYSNPGTGGVGGANDGYLRVENDLFEAQLGARALDAAYTGDWTAAGATGLSFWLRDVSQTNPIEIHVGIGQAFGNFWLYTPGFNLTSEWQEFSVDFSDPSQWTRIIGGGTFEDALTVVDRVLFRHDLAPFNQQPNFIMAGFGIDRITILPTPGAAGVLGLATLAALRRRR